MLSDEEKKKYEEIKYNNGYLYCDKEDVDCLIDIIEKQSKEIEELEKNRKVSQNFAKIVATDYISKDKIKAKIEGLTENILENDYASDYDKDIAEYQVIILQSLLEKE